MTVMWLISASDEGGVADAEARGWVRIAAKRFATPEKHDVRVVRSMSELVVGQTAPIKLIKGSEYESGPLKGREADPLAWIRWDAERPEFDKLVQSGAAIWVDPDAENGDGEDVQAIGDSSGF